MNSQLGDQQAPTGLQPPLYNIIWQPEDSTSKVVGNGDEQIGEDRMDSISSVLRKEIEGKVSISNPKAQLAALKGKESLGKSFSLLIQWDLS